MRITASRGRRAARAVVAVLGVLWTSLAALAQPAALAPNVLVGDASRGKTLYQACAACHSIDENDVGPKHRGIVGRPAASIADYDYSPALKRSGITWDEATLDRWLVNPSALVPGTKMFFRIDDAQARADLIAYLKQQK
ncbi:MAG TPA: cytochrome c family protein [Caldimonas sp.]|nr:cytochrome c family protein [Caldimonas sp.]HEX4234027.1 cytochrome c family protein [Caldimonas sp.]